MRQLVELPRQLTGATNPGVHDPFTLRSDARGWFMEYVNEEHQARCSAQAFIHDAYARAFGADITQFYPSILTLSDDQSRLLGALGARWASGQELFLECYLDRPVCELIGNQAGVPVNRDAIVELGNIALGRPVVTHTFMSLIGAWLHHFQVSWLVCALTSTLRRLFVRSGVELLHLAPARPERLGEKARAWGSYYSHDPTIVAIELAPSLLRFNQRHGVVDESRLRNGRCAG